MHERSLSKQPAPFKNVTTPRRLPFEALWAIICSMSQQVKLLLSFNIRAGSEGAYRRFVLEELLPKAQELGLTPTDAWHTAYGNYPLRLIGFTAENLDVAHAALDDADWRAMMRRLEGYTEDLSRRLVSFRGGFQW